MSQTARQGRKEEKRFTFGQRPHSYTIDSSSPALYKNLGNIVLLYVEHIITVDPSQMYLISARFLVIVELYFGMTYIKWTVDQCSRSLRIEFKTLLFLAAAAAAAAAEAFFFAPPLNVAFLHPGFFSRD